MSLDRYLSSLAREWAEHAPDRAVLAGAVVTAAATYLLFLVPETIPFEAFRDRLFGLTGFYFWDDPFPTLRFLGGFAGGYVAGYLTRDTWYLGYGNGIRAVVLGLGLYYVGTSLESIVAQFLAGNLTGSVAMIILIQPLLFTIFPLLLLYFFQGSIASPIGNHVAKVVSSRLGHSPDEGEPDRASAWRAVTLRGTVASLVFAALFGVVWWFGFYFEVQY